MNTKFLRFLISGGTAAAIEYTTFLLLEWSMQSDSLLLNQTLSFLAGLITSFLLNRNWVFKSNGNGRTQFTKYLLLAGINLAIGNLVIATLVEHLGLAAEVAKILVMALIAIWNYALLSVLVFADGKKRS